jgi:hypothetical protein
MLGDTVLSDRSTDSSVRWGGRVGWPLQRGRCGSLRGMPFSGECQMGGGGVGGRGWFWRSASGSEAPPWGIRTPQPTSKSPAEGGARGEEVLGPYAQRKCFRARRGPPKPASAPHSATTHLALAGVWCAHTCWGLAGCIAQLRIVCRRTGHRAPWLRCWSCC